jgi:hypothetical protein
MRILNDNKWTLFSALSSGVIELFVSLKALKRGSDADTAIAHLASRLEELENRLEAALQCPDTSEMSGSSTETYCTGGDSKPATSCAPEQSADSEQNTSCSDTLTSCGI